MKNLFFYISISLISQKAAAQQQDYCDFDGIKNLSFGQCTGVLDSASLNTVPDLGNNSLHCAKYIRDTTTYDVIKMFPDTTLIDVSPYANFSGSAPKITLKIYSTAPVGTPVQLQLGLKGNDTYPAGVHSVYTANTTATHAWQLMTFSYFQSPSGSTVTSTNVNKIVLLFHPASSSRDTIYFDELTGPAILPNTVGIQQTENTRSAFKLYQNNPNPARESTQIKFQINSPGFVSIKLYDMLGNSVSSIVNENMKTGSYSIPVETENIPAGIYFYVLKKDGVSRTLKMTVSK